MVLSSSSSVDLCHIFPIPVWQWSSNMHLTTRMQPFIKDILWVSVIHSWDTVLNKCFVKCRYKLYIILLSTVFPPSGLRDVDSKCRDHIGSADWRRQQTAFGTLYIAGRLDKTNWTLISVIRIKTLEELTEFFALNHQLRCTVSKWSDAWIVYRDLQLALRIRT